MKDSLAELKSALATRTHGSEELLFHGSGWTEGERKQARTLLLEAAENGDSRVPAALGLVCSSDELVADLGELMGPQYQPSVRIYAALASTRRLGDQIAGMYPIVSSGQVSDHTASILLDLWLKAGHVSLVRNLLGTTRDVGLRRLCVDRLWIHYGYDIYPTKWWTGLGLMKAYLSVKMESFQQFKLQAFLRLDGQPPRVAGFPPVMGRMSPSLKQARADLTGPPGPHEQRLIDPLTVDEREGLLTKAAEAALSLQPRALLYVAHLGGERHRDLIEWAAALPHAQMAATARSLLQPAPA